MTSGGADVKLIFWEIACPGKARFRERWVRHQLDSGQGLRSEEAPHAASRPSVALEASMPVPPPSSRAGWGPASPAATPRLTGVFYRVVQSGG
ncbi:hypothetical protein J3F84DRAFT_56163 [Trichoderma pleuroticola]